MVNIKDFGGKGDNKTDNRPALNEAIDHIVASMENKVGDDYIISFAAGKYIFKDAPKPFPIGIKLVGNGVVGSSGLGTVLIADFDAESKDDFLCWNGSVNFRGTGGGIQDICIMKGHGKRGGNAVKLVGSAKENRCGFWDGSNIFIGGLAHDPQPAEAIWSRCLFVDGTNVAIPGSMGVRDLSLLWWNFSRASIATVELRGATHFFASNGQIFDGGEGAPTAKFIVTGEKGKYKQSIDVHFSTCSLWGELKFDYVTRFSFMGGMASKVRITENAHDGLLDTLSDDFENKGNNVDARFVKFKKDI